MYSVDEWEDDDSDYTPVSAVPIARHPAFAECKFPVCTACGGPYPSGKRDVQSNPVMMACKVCDGIGYTNIECGPGATVGHQKGGETFLAIYAMRYQRGLDIYTGLPLSHRKHQRCS